MGMCVLCNEKAGMFSARTLDGRLCKKCKAYVPASVRLQEADKEYLASVVEKNKKHSEQFSSTASYGRLFIDSLHNMVCVSKASIKGEPLNFGEVYTLDELDNISIYCTNVRDVGTAHISRIVCDIGLSLAVDGIAHQYIIVRNERCKFTRVDSENLSVQEPEKLTMFRNIMLQMFEDALYGLAKHLAQIQATKKEIASQPKEGVEWAKGVLFLDKEENSIDAIKKRYREMMMIFHPDRSDLANLYAQKLNKAYDILKSTYKSRT